ncbi:MAG: class I SAM-dependent methyltransferase, partial [Actinomycetota bacterium]|nr:class I SAM-dependent methyltransferase [Actinomycetota bacterium]
MHLDRDQAARLREALLAAAYTTSDVADLLGPVAHAALARQETVPARRATTGGSPLETLIRLFLLQLPVDERALQRALPVDAGVAAGLVERAGGDVRARLDLRPYDEDFYVVSDLDAGLDAAVRPVSPDHVIGLGGASATLAELTPRRPVGRALDIGTGSGVQSLHLTGHADRVVATDVSARALALARLSAGLSGVDFDLREGSLYAPVAGERFDLIVSNPPFVVSPAARFTYRDSGLPGDELCRRLVAGAAGHLEEGGTFVCLANWVHGRGEPWGERVRSWLPQGCDAWVVQREVEDPAQYVSLWLHDSGDVHRPEFVELYDVWLAGFEAAGVEAVGFGWITLRRTPSQQPTVRVEEWPHAVEQPLGPHVQAWFERQQWLRGHDDDALLDARPRVASDVVQEQLGPPGAEDPERIVLRQHRGLRR